MATDGGHTEVLQHGTYGRVFKSLTRLADVYFPALSPLKHPRKVSVHFIRSFYPPGFEGKNGTKSN